MSLYAFILRIWASATTPTPIPPPTPKKLNRRRPKAFVPGDIIEPINHWYPGDRSRHSPRKLVNTPDSAHWPKFRIAKTGVAKGRRRCEACGALVREVGGDAKSAKAVESGRSGKTVKTVRRKAAAVKAAERREVEREVQVQVEGGVGDGGGEEEAEGECC